ncbi:MAG: aminodeoxychorismate synthase component I [Candidatus Sericytochromatia bacterium]|nr:aminodeoxychorismate synthase component I [Candidatus Sericytochromatia bacterium]
MTAEPAAPLYPLDAALWWQSRLLLRRYSGFVLEGAGQGYSYLGLQPVRSWTSTATTTTVQTAAGTEQLSLDPFAAVEHFWQPSGHTSSVPFVGGLVGYFAYEVAPWCESTVAAHESDLPLSAWMQVDSVLVWDHAKETAWLAIRPGTDIAAEKARWDTLWAELAETPPEPTPFTAQDLRRNVDADGYGAWVRAAQAHITAGDIYQANLAITFEAEATGDPFTCYERLRAVNPGPYNGYLNFGDLQIVSGSPERLIRKEGRHVITRPIAGTRRRGRNEQDDQAMADELLLNPKERAEHIMLVDLSRNDLGRICRPGSVRVDELMVIESYSHVHHIVSNVIGELADDQSWQLIVRALFPGGTITGAPKVRAMQIIQALETGPRGIYTGAIGYLADSGDLDLNIAIRTAVVYGGRIRWHAGAGIVADSIPAREYAECGHKARALQLAIGIEETAHV